jgi:hypothetical protein
LNPERMHAKAVQATHKKKYFLFEIAAAMMKIT